MIEFHPSEPVKERRGFNKPSLQELSADQSTVVDDKEEKEKEEKEYRRAKEEDGKLGIRIC